MFLRGLGSYDAARTSGSLGVVQEDAMRPITGGININSATYSAYGAFQVGSQDAVNAGPITYGYSNSFTFNSALLGSRFSGAETRPVNTAVRYLVKALR